MTAEAYESKPRRPQWDRNRQRILEVAQREFIAAGYRETTTKAIAMGTGLSEVTLFKHFSAKTTLFEAAISEPLREIVAQWTVDRPERSVDEADLPTRVRHFYERLLADQALEGRLFFAVARELDNTDSLQELGPSVAATMELFMQTLDAAFTVRHADAEGATQPGRAARLILGMLLSVGLHRRWLLPGDPPGPADDDLIGELCELTLWGLMGPRGVPRSPRGTGQSGVPEGTAEIDGG